nr:ABC transporter permease [Ardenticatenales bacterium]
MTQYIIRRVLASIPVLFGILAITFAMARMIPGEPCKAILGEKATPEVCERFIKAKGLDQPIPVQFAIYMKDMARGDFGSSIRFNRTISDILIDRMPVTIELSMSAMLLAMAVGIPAGIFSAVRRNSPIDVATMALSNLGVSIPVFFLGLLLAYLFALVLKDTPLQLPPSGRLSAGLESIPFYEVYGWQVEEGTKWFSFVRFISNFYIFNSLITGSWEVLKDSVQHLILPTLALSTIPMAIIARMTR